MNFGKLGARGGFGSLGVLGGAGKSPVTPYIGQLATRCMPPNSLTSLGATSFLMARSRHIARANITAAGIVLPGWYYSHAAGPAEAALGGAATVTASFEYPVGTFTQITFSASATGTITNNTSLTSDQVPVNIPKGAAFFVRTFWTSTSGILYQATNNDGLTPTSTNMQSNDIPNGDIVHYGSSGITDQTMGGTITSTDPNGTIGFSPLAIIGPTTQPSFYIMGDSRSRGISDFYSDASSNIGQGSRIIGPSYGYINGGCTGILAHNWLAGFPKQQALAALCSHIYCALGINDLSNTITAAALITSLQTIWTTYGASRVVQATLPPETTSTDAWLTTTNQTPAAWDAQRTAFNDAVRAGISGSIGFVEIADVAEGGRNLGKWRVDTITAQFTATQSVEVATVSAVASGTLKVGDVIGSNGVIDRKFIQSLGTGVGLTGTYNVSGPQTIGSATAMVANPTVQDGIHETPVMNNLYLSSGAFNPANYHYP